MIPSEAPTRLRLDDVPKDIRLRYGHEVSRRTVFNWVTTGVKGMKLQTRWVSCRKISNYGRYRYRVTTNIWVDEFMRQAKPELH